MVGVLSALSLAASDVGTFSMPCASPDRSAAARVASFGRMRSVTFSHGDLPPHQLSFRASSRRSLFVYLTTLYGPAPIAAFPLLKSSVDALAYCLEMIATCIMSVGISG